MHPRLAALLAEEQATETDADVSGILTDEEVEALVREYMEVESAYEARTSTARMEASLATFARAAWHVVVPGTKLVWEPHMDAICWHLESIASGAIRNLVINVPPGTSKSLLANVFMPAWVWATRPAMKFLYAANEESLVVRDSVACRRLIDSEWYKSRWSKSFELTTDQNVKTWYENSRRGFRICATVGGSVTGKRADIIVADDLHDAKKALSEAEREKVKKWFFNSFANRLNDYKTGRRVSIGQRVHQDDLSNDLLERNWEHLCLPEEFDPRRRCKTSIGFEDWRSEYGELLRPLRFGPDEIKTARQDLLEFGYQTQHQQDPQVLEGSLFKSDWFVDKVVPITTMPEKCSYLRYWDKAGTEGGGAYTCGVLVARAKDQRLFVVDVIRKQLNVYDREKLIVETAREDTSRFGTTHIVIEQEPGSAGKESVQATIGRLVGYMASKDKVTGSKFDRAKPFAAQCGAGNVYVIRAHWNKAWFDEILSFPESKYKDQVDASAGAVAHIGKCMAPGTWKLERW